MRLGQFLMIPLSTKSFVAWALLSAASAGAQDREPVDPKGDSPAAQDTQSAEWLANMRRRAEHTQVFVVDDNRRDEVKMRAEPVFRYADQPRGIVDATLWVWGEPGRPVALEKVEYYPPTPTKWTYCLTSLSSGLIAADWRGGRRWNATKPGVEMRPLEGAPEPAATKPARMRQMRDIARRFTVKGSEGTSRGEQLRLISQPIHRYADAKAELEDGTIFGFGSGTNPNCLLLVELRGRGKPDERWQYGFVGMSAESLRAKLDDREVWYFPPTAATGGRDSWIWFFESPGMED